MNNPMRLRTYKPRIDLLEGRVILVTGANRGIGRAVARDLTRHGATVILHGRDVEALDALHSELRQLGPEPAIAALDLELAQGEDYHDLTSRLESRFGKLDGLLHNASILGDRSPVEHYDIGLWQRVMHINFNAAFILTRCLLPLMRRSEDASMVFTTSGVGNQGRAYWGAYCCSKFATEGLTQTLADELENTNIRVNCIDPGAVRTAMRQAAYPAEDPLTLATPESLTSAYLYLLGPDGRRVNGGRIRAQP